MDVPDLIAESEARSVSQPPSAYACPVAAHRIAPVTVYPFDHDVARHIR